MSTIKVTNIEHASTANGGIQLDSAGHVTVDGMQMPTVGPLSNRNLVTNGAAQVNQRGTLTLTASNYGGPDRFYTYMSATNYACQRSQQLDAPANSGLQYSLALGTTSARTGTTADQYVAVGQTLEFQDIHDAIWGGHSHLTMSFWVKSSIAGTYAFNINPCNTNSGLSGNRVLYHTTYTINSAQTWEKKTITIPLADFTNNYGILSTTNSAQIGRGLELTWVLGISSGGSRTTASTGWSTTEGRNIVSSFANDLFLSTVGATFKLTGVQLEVGEKATPFEHRSYGDELAKCMRYCQRYDGGRICLGIWSNSSNADTMRGMQHLPVWMRATPTLSAVTLGNALKEGVAWYAVTSVVIQAEASNKLIVYNVVTGSDVVSSSTNGTVPGAWGNGAKLTLEAEL